MKVELPEGGRLQPGPAGNVVMATCAGRDGSPNIITLGMYMPISRRPPLVCIGVAPQRFSHTLLEETGEFVINTLPSTSRSRCTSAGSSRAETWTSLRRRG